MVSFTPQPCHWQGKKSGAHRLGALVSLKADLDIVAKRKVILKSLNTASHVVLYSVIKYSVIC
jgi:hypothetical protein